MEPRAIWIGGSDQPRRGQDRRTEQPVEHQHEAIQNEPVTDWSLPTNRVWIEGVAAHWRKRQHEHIPLQVGGAFIPGPPWAEGIDPSRPEQIAFQHALAGAEHVNHALDVAVTAQQAWSKRSHDERRTILLEIAATLVRRRGRLDLNTLPV